MTREEQGYRESANLIEPNVRLCDDLTFAAITRIERDADGCTFVTNHPIAEGHGRMRVSQALARSDEGILQVLFTLHIPDDDVCSLWFVRVVAAPEG